MYKETRSTMQNRVKQAPEDLPEMKNIQVPTALIRTYPKTCPMTQSGRLEARPAEAQSDYLYMAGKT